MIGRILSITKTKNLYFPLHIYRDTEVIPFSIPRSTLFVLFRRFFDFLNKKIQIKAGGRTNRFDRTPQAI